MAGTLIHTEDGTEAIENIRPGDYVLAYNEETGETGYKKVVNLFRNTTEELAHVKVAGTEEIICTLGHKFYVEGKWIPAGEMKQGDVLTLADGATTEVLSVTIEKLETPVTIYNFEVEDWHTYYVADSGVLVHNMNCGDLNTTVMGAGNIGKSGTGSKGLIDGAPEPEVQNFIERFKEKYPGREYKSGHKLQHSDGRNNIEIDFETDNAILEFKRGNGKGLTRQIIDRQDPIVNPNGKVVIGVPGSKMSRFAQQDVENAGGLMSNDIDLILELIKPD